MTNNYDGLIFAGRISQDSAIRQIQNISTQTTGDLGDELREMALNLIEVRKAYEECVNRLGNGTLPRTFAGVPKALTATWWDMYSHDTIKTAISSKLKGAYKVVDSSLVKRVAATMHSLAATTKEIAFVIRMRKKYLNIIEEARKELVKFNNGNLLDICDVLLGLSKNVNDSNLLSAEKHLSEVRQTLHALDARIEYEKNVKFIRIPKTSTQKYDCAQSAKRILELAGKIPLEDTTTWNHLQLGLVRNF